MESKLIKKAEDFVKNKHAGQIDDKGIWVFESHLIVVANILSQVTNDEEVIAAGLLHDVLEDTSTTYEELKNGFNERIANLVLEVTQEGEKDQYGYYFPRLKSLEAIWIKYADRLSNLTRMDPWPKKRQEQYLKKSKFWRSRRGE